MTVRQNTIVVIPCYNAERTLAAVYRQVTQLEAVDHVIVVDDGSSDRTSRVARSLPGSTLFIHHENRGYGAAQKTAYRAALGMGADVIAMVHGDGQYTPTLIPQAVRMIADGSCHVVLGSRFLDRNPLDDGMPVWRYVGNRVLTHLLNRLCAQNLSEWHTGLRVFSRRAIEGVQIEKFSDGFEFDIQLLAHLLPLVVAELSCPADYGPHVSSIGFWRGIEYGTHCLTTSVRWRLLRGYRVANGVE